jgi:two-component system, OmpR family, sensor histidine kinase VicK
VSIFSKVLYLFIIITLVDSLTIEATSSSDGISERTDVLHGEQNVVNTVLQFISKAKSRIDACVDYTRPSLAVEIEELRKAFLDAKRRGVRLRYVTEITEFNVGYCKELIKMVDELRHLEGIRGNFYVNETEYIAPATLHHKGKPASQITYSNVKEIVQHHKHYVFDTLWSRAIPAKQRIKEIETGTAALSDETKIALEYQYQIFKKIKNSIEKDQTNKIRLMLQPIIQKQSRDAERQLEIIKQLQYQLKQLQKQVSDTQKTITRTKKKDR